MSEHTLREEHTPHAIAARLRAEPRPSYLRDAVYGAVDGTVTTFAVVAGAAGARLPAAVIVILGVANLLADGLSMAVGNLLGLRSEEQRRLRVRRQEEHHVAAMPAGEREEVRQLLARDGFEGELLERATAAITSDRERWIQLMMAREHGFGSANPSPWRAAATTFAAFVTAGLLPLLAYLVDALPLVDVGAPLVVSVGLTAVSFFVIGAVKGIVVDEPRIRSGLTILAIGGGTAAVAYAVGVALAPIL